MINDTELAAGECLLTPKVSARPESALPVVHTSALGMGEPVSRACSARGWGYCRTGE